MITCKIGDIFKENAEALVNTVNCVGVMGRGMALQFKKAFPDNFKSYSAACKRDEIKPGTMFVHKTGLLTNPRFIINFPTKRHWRGKSRIEDIHTGLVALVEAIRFHNISSIAIPPLGCGLGGLDWSEVYPLIRAKIEKCENLEAVIFEPGTRSHELSCNRSTEVPKMTVGRAILVGLMQKYLAGLLDPYITLLEVHKLMYFMQEADEPLRLKFTKGHYGPYASNLSHVFNVVEGHFISGYHDGGDDPKKILKLIPRAIENASSVLEERSETTKRFERVCDLVEGFESSFGLELLSTVHWIIKCEDGSTLEDVVDKIYAWNDRKKKFTQRQIEIAIDVLSCKNWVSDLRKT